MPADHPMQVGPTDKEYPPSKGAAALQHAIRRIGEREVGGQNQGEIVRWSTRWLWTERLQEYERLYVAGKMAWCAGFAGRCYLEAGIPVGSYWSGWCPALLMRLWSPAQQDLWVVQRWPCEVHPGDVVFFGRGPDRKPVNLEEAKGMRHVELAERYDGTTLYSVGGNTTRTTDRVARCERLAAAAEIYAVAHAL